MAQVYVESSVPLPRQPSPDSFSGHIAVSEGESAGIAPSATCPSEFTFELPRQLPAESQRYPRAVECLTKADRLIENGLLHCQDWRETHGLYYEAGALFAVSGYTEEAALAFLKASAISSAFSDEDETVTAMELAADNLRVKHPHLMLQVLASLTPSYEKCGLHLQVAKSKRDTAEIYETVLQDLPNAIVFYREAIECYRKKRSSLTASLQRACHHRICCLQVLMGNYDEACTLFLEAAKMLPRGLPCAKYFLMSLLSLFAKGSGGGDSFFDALYLTKKRFDVFQEEERTFQSGKEHQFARAMLAAMDAGSLNQYDAAVKAYLEYNPTEDDPIYESLAARARQNLFEHLQQFMMM